jgi:uncharacterized membrane protein YdbT with pleckstrin-like domain
MVDNLPPRRPGFTSGTEDEVWRGGPAMRSAIYLWLVSTAAAWFIFLMWDKLLMGLYAQGIFSPLGSLSETLFPEGEAPVWWLSIIPWVLCIFPAFWYTVNLAVVSYELTTQRLIVRAGILVRTHDQLELFRVRDFLIDTPLHLGILGISHIRIISRDESLPVLTLLAQTKPEQLLNTIRNKVQARKDEVGMREFETNVI